MFMLLSIQHLVTLVMFTLLSILHLVTLVMFMLLSILHLVTLVMFTLLSILHLVTLVMFMLLSIYLLGDLTPGKNGLVSINMEDEVIRGTTVVHNGKITWPPPAPVLRVATTHDAIKTPAAEQPTMVEIPTKTRALVTLAGIAIGVLSIVGVGAIAPAEFMNHFMVFVLACFVGWQVVWNVTPALHTPLMSVTNAISGIIVIGALLQIGSSSTMGAILAMTAVVIAAVNIVGGFLVTQRMLNMFRK